MNNTPVRLVDLYDADRRATDPQVHRLANDTLIPHPLRNVQYTDGMRPCTHAKRHTDPWTCPWGEDDWRADA
jgi:hypothetical protein